MGDEYEPYQWQVGDPSDWGDSVGVPDIPYMGYINNGDDDDNDPPWEGNRNLSPSENLRRQAWDLREQERFSEALVMINRAIELDGSNYNYYNVRAIILEDLRRYDEALTNYDIALRMRNSQTVKNNKARLLESMAIYERYRESNFNTALDLINEALKISDDETDRPNFLRRKADILNLLGKKVESMICIYLANGMYDKVDETERQTKVIEESTDTLICIAGRNFYSQKIPLTAGVKVDLVREPTNEYDPDAIRVEVDGNTVGYVANSSYTLIDRAKSATDIKNIVKEDQKAEILFVYIDEYTIAKLI